MTLLSITDLITQAKRSGKEFKKLKVNAAGCIALVKDDAAEEFRVHIYWFSKGPSNGLHVKRCFLVIVMLTLSFQLQLKLVFCVL